LKDHDPLDEGTRSSWSSYLISGALLACLFFFFAIISVRLAATVMKDVSTATPLKKYQKITRLDPFDETAWNTLGRIYYYLGKNKKAGEALTKALSLNCLYYPAWINVMWLSIQTKQAAPEHITQRVRVIDLLNPRDFSIHWKILMRMLTIDAPWARTVALNEIKVLLTLQGSNKGQLFQLAEMILGDDHRLISFVPDEKNIKTPLLSYFLYRKTLRKKRSPSGPIPSKTFPYYYLALVSLSRAAIFWWIRLKPLPWPLVFRIG
jgi:tetratricopeptide (TPR) repeat protein